jgi:hypothetical protein
VELPWGLTSLIGSGPADLECRRGRLVLAACVPGGAQRLDAEPHQVRRADELEDGERRLRGADQRGDADGRGDGPDRQSGADAQRGAQPSAAAVDEHVLGHDGGVGTRDDDDDRRDADEDEQVEPHG